MANKLKLTPAWVYQLAFNSGLGFCGVEASGEPMFIGIAKEFSNFNAGIVQRLNKQADSLS